MSPVFAARRRAEEFDALVEARAAGRPVEDARFDDLLDVVGALRSSPQPQARPEFVSDLRQQLMTAAAAELRPAATASPATAARLSVAPQRTRRDRRIAAAVGGLAIVGASSTMAVASQSALPGDVLYPLKRAIENVATGVSTSDERRGGSLLSHAAGRLAEVDALSRDEEGQDLEAIESTLVSFTEQASEASQVLLGDYAETGDETTIVELQEFTVDSMGVLEDLSAVLPAPAQDVLVTAGTLLAEIDQTTQQLCPTCSGSTIGQVPTFLVNAAEALLGDLVTPPAGDDRAATGSQDGSGKAGSGKKGDGSGAGGAPSTSTPPGTVTLPTPGATPTQGAGASGPSGSDGSGSGQGPLSGLTENLPGTGTPTGSGGGKGGGGAVSGTVEDVVEGVTGLVEGLTDPLLP
ncbi:DUF5667 domain-containing protein [Nocardioides sp. 31GB23]|uniref:DUF5667 domain-containing protein n=1 Tax=Nocardioides sp. 31GB23 TaxID=3156065 RepID=UPI0032AEDF55